MIGSAGLMSAQQVTSGIFGYFKLTLLGNSDTIVSIPFARLPVATVSVGALISSNVVQFQGSPGWTNGQFVYASGQSNTYYARIESGALEGRYYDVVTNDAASLTLNLKGDTLTALATNDQISVIPYWTLGTVFVNGNGIVPSTTTKLKDNKTQVLIPGQTNSGINLSSSAAYFLYTNAGSLTWQSIPVTSNRNDDILMPNSYIIIRHNNVATNTTFISFGDVILTKVTLPLNVNASGGQDNSLGMTRPIQVSLANSGLASSGAFAQSPTTKLKDLKDLLLVFDNTTTNFNKSASGAYFYYANSWRLIGDTNNFDYSSSNVFLPGQGFIIRKASTNSILLWTNTPTYTNN